nr:serine/threonine protein kinase [Myxococcota bacterium]
MTAGTDTDADPGAREPSVDIDLASSELRLSGELSIELPALRKFAGYELLGRLAVGGMAEVFVARERSEGDASRLLALKVVRAHLESDASFGEMFLREGQVALGLRHPNICHVYRFGVEEGHYFIAMELVAGITVQDLLVPSGGQARRKLPAPIAVKIASAVAEALHSAHTAKDARGRALRVVHQDVSPHNLMVAYDGTVKLLDFGVAHSAMEGAPSAAAPVAEPSHTTIRGKFAYIAPEQCRGVDVDPRTDVFSLGICLFEMLTGRRLFKRGSTIQTLNAIVAEPLPELASLGVELPDALARVLDKALQKAPRDRYQTAAEMQEDLERFLADERLAVTSTKIAELLRELLGDEAERAASLDTRPEVVAWLRSGPTPAPATPV